MRAVPSASLTLDQSRGRGTEVQHLAATPATPSLPQRFPGRPHPNRRRRCPRVNTRTPAGSPHGEPPRGAPALGEPQPSRDRPSPGNGRLALRPPRRGPFGLPTASLRGAERPCRQLASGGRDRDRTCNSPGILIPGDTFPDTPVEARKRRQQRH